DPSAGEFAVMGICDGGLSVEYDREIRSLGTDFIRIPFTAGFGHRHHLGDVDNSTSTVIRLRPLIEDVHFISRLGGHTGWIGTADEDAAVHIVTRPKLA